jgi:hypothetical protein
VYDTKYSSKTTYTTYTYTYTTTTTATTAATDQLNRIASTRVAYN